MIEERIMPGSESWREHGLQHMDRYLFASKHIAGKRVLDLACGSGYGTYILKHLGAKEVTGIDVSVEAISTAKANHSIPGIEFMCCDAAAWKPNEKYDAIISFETVEHLTKPDIFLESLAEALLPNGLLIISSPNVLHYSKAKIPVKNEFHKTEMTYGEFVSLVSAKFLIQEQWEQSIVVDRKYAELNRRFELASLILSSWTIRLLLKWESIIRRLLRRSPLRTALGRATVSNELEAYTKIVPLFPARRQVANVFIFVAGRK
jgi:2-polyprenyl-3-methyl-5-hydroxy-6-metoxy-1,4-benzoquinol methylase